MRTLKLAILASIIGLIPSIAIGQLENYPLKDYKLPLIRRTSLDLGFTTNSNGLTGDVTGDGSQKTTTDKFYFSGQGDANWNYYFNSPKWQTSSTASVSISGSASTYVQEQVQNYSTTGSNLVSSINFGNSSLYYFNKKLFLSFSPQAYTNYIRQKFSYNEKDNSGATTLDYTNYFNKSSSYFSTGFGVGYGRIEPVWDAHKMIFTLLDLKKEGRLLREPTTEEITEISQKLSSLMNERYFDTREHTIKEVTVLDSLLTSMGLTKNGDIGVSTALYDNLSYAYLPQRFSGFRVGLEPRIGYNLYSTKQTGMDRENSHQLTLGIQANLTYQTPINIHWQRTLRLSASYTDMNIDTKNISPTSKYKESDVSLSGGYGYYPNTRTYFDLTAGGRFRYIDSDQTVNNQPYRLKYGEVFANGELYYYLSPKVRIDASAQVSYKTNIDANSIYYSYLNFDPSLYNTFTSKELSYTFSAKFTYALF